MRRSLRRWSRIIIWGSIKIILYNFLIKIPIAEKKFLTWNMYIYVENFSFSVPTKKICLIIVKIDII
jgi:hypothetical protein